MGGSLALAAFAASIDTARDDSAPEADCSRRYIEKVSIQIASHIDELLAARSGWFWFLPS